MVSAVFPSPCPPYVLPFSLLSSRCQCGRERNYLRLLEGSCITGCGAPCPIATLLRLIGNPPEGWSCYSVPLLFPGGPSNWGGKQEGNLGVPTLTLLQGSRGTKAVCSGVGSRIKDPGSLQGHPSWGCHFSSPRGEKWLPQFLASYLEWKNLKAGGNVLL